MVSVLTSHSPGTEADTSFGAQEKILKRLSLTLFILFSAVSLTLALHSHAGGNNVYIGLNIEAGHPTSTSGDAIKQGILVAIDEINNTGGVLGGRKLELIEKDNRSVPARAVQNNLQFAAIPDLVAVFTGKFSSAIIESLPSIHLLELPVMAPWSANDKVIDNGFFPNYVFRLSITDTWAIGAMMSHVQKKGYGELGLILTNTIWGRSNLEAIKKFIASNPKIKVTSTQWVNSGESSMTEKYEAILESGAKAIVLATIEPEAASLVKTIARMPPEKRLPIVGVASVTGGDFTKMTGDDLGQVNLVFAQTFNIHEIRSEKVKTVMVTARRLFGINDPVEIKSPMGFVHAYDLMNILSLAINRAGSTDRTAVHDALEKITDYDGLIKYYKQPFTETNHEALGPQDVIMAEYDASGVIRRVE